MLGAIDRYKKPDKVRLFLCKPNRQTLAELTDVMGVELKTSYNGIHELSFRIPYKVIRRNKIVVNPHFNSIRGDYLIRYVKGNVEEYFVIDKPTESGSDKDEKTIQCFLSPYSLGKVLVRNYSDTKKLYDPVGSDGFLNDTLIKKTNWSVGYVDGDLLTKFRTMDVTEQSLIEFIQSLNDAFDCMSVWDTKNKQVSFYKYDNWGTDKGLLIEEGKYLKSISGEPDFASVATRLYVYGKEDLTFNSVNPTGTDFIESFAYYLYPFERDANKNTIKESFYMSNGLCHAILDYNDLVASKQGLFSTLLSQKETDQNTQMTKENELADLQIQLDTIQDNIDIAKAQNQSTTTLDAQYASKLSEVNAKQTEINAVIADINNIDTQIAQIKSQIAIENNFTSDQIIERNEFIKEKIMNNQYISDEKELYDFAVTEMVKISQPLIHYTIDIVDFTKVVQCQRDWSKLVYGDIVTIRYPKFNVDIKARIISITHNEDTNSVQLEIANSQDIKNGFTQIKDIYQKATSSSTSIDMSKYKWDKSEQNQESIASIMNSDIDAFSKRIIAGVDESVEISRRGISIKSTITPDDMLVMQAGAFGLLKNGEYKVAMSPELGVVAEVIKGKLIAGVNLQIQNESADYVIDDNGFTITSTDQKKRVLLDIDNGLKFQIKTATGYDDRLFYDNTNDLLVIKGEIDADEMKVKGVSVLTGDKSKISGNFIDSITTNQLVAGSAKITSAMIDTITADQITGNTFTVGNDATTTKLTLTTTDANTQYDYHTINSNHGNGFRIESASSLSLRANSDYGVYVDNAQLVARAGFRVDGGVTQFYSTASQGAVTINGSLTVTTLNVTGSAPGLYAKFG